MVRIDNRRAERSVKWLERAFLSIASYRRFVTTMKAEKE